ncbi:2-hydroxyacyl-CoA dehydratase subunit D [Bacillus sp. Marseille-P3661]|uniref:2-hydroxyacyl-CoA dehydratase subunit D n=1 Tax=Bacillus sp. Marseille-P3661 TaxID=1936234 RepID=UPI0015E162BC|nr:2-hydroxyacyl-CoA dehydratase family protein [Bacillus sp. Marseille-P3661]
MSIEQNSEHSVLKEISKIYSTPDEIALYSSQKDKKIIGYLGNDIPVELLIAAGCHPIQIRGRFDKDPHTANQYLESGFDPRVKMQMGQIIDGSYGFLEHLIVTNSSDAIIRIYYYLRALKETDPNINLPELYFYDFLHSKLRNASLYNLDRTRELIQELEKWCDKTISDTDLVNAIKLCNETRRLLKRFSELRGPEVSYINGVQAQQVIGASHLIPREEYNQLLKTFLEDAEQLIPIEGPRIFVSGSTHEHIEFYEMVESFGAIIVGEDHDISIRNYIEEIDTDPEPLEAIVDYYHIKRSLPSSQSTVSERVYSIVKNVSATNSQGVIFFIHHADDAPSWDYPEQKKALEAMGVPVLLIDRQQYHLVNKDQVADKVKDFINLLNEKQKAETVREEIK